MSLIKRNETTSFILLFVSLILFMLSVTTGSSPVFVWALLFITVGEVLYCLADFHNRIGLSFFLLCVFTFLTATVIIRYFRGSESWMLGFNRKEFNAACIMLYLSYFFLVLGTAYGKRRIKRKHRELRYIHRIIDDNGYSIKRIQDVSFLLMIIFTFGALLFEYRKLVYVLQNGYASLYTTYDAGSLWGERFTLLSTATLFIGLASKPSKIRTYIFLLLGMLEPIIILLQGARGGFVTYLLFVIFYLYSREFMLNGEWGNINEKRKLIRYSINLLLIAIVALPALYNYGFTRVGQKSDVNKLISGFWGFFESNGESFRILALADKYKGCLYNNLYSIGSILDRLSHTTYITKADYATMGHSFADAITYTVEYYSYLGGYGMGSSYIAELYYDFGVIGVSIANFFIGVLLQRMVSWKSNSVFEQAVMFIVFRNMLGMPRGAFLRPLDILLSTSTIVVFLLIFGLSRKRIKRCY